MTAFILTVRIQCKCPKRCLYLTGRTDRLERGARGDHMQQGATGWSEKSPKNVPNNAEEKSEKFPKRSLKNV